MREKQSLYDLIKEQNEEFYNTTGISLEKWRELGENGIDIPMRIPLHGRSMKPLIRPEKDIVTIMPMGDNCQRADVPMKREDVYGLIVSMERDGRTYQLDTDKQRTFGIRWMKYGRKAWMVLKRIKRLAGR